MVGEQAWLCRCFAMRGDGRLNRLKVHDYLGREMPPMTLLSRFFDSILDSARAFVHGWPLLVHQGSSDLEFWGGMGVHGLSRYSGQWEHARKFCLLGGNIFVSRRLDIPLSRSSLAL
jgi:hypothetical protein